MDGLRRVALVLFFGVLAVAACLAWLLRKFMGKKPAEVTRSIKEKVAAVKASRAHPVAEQGAAISEAPSVVPEAEAHCPQGAPWCCSVCGNVATGPVCTVDGAKGNA